MIEYIEGILSSKGPTHAVIDVQGIGYRIFIPIRRSKRSAEDSGNLKTPNLQFFPFVAI